MQDAGCERGRTHIWRWGKVGVLCQLRHGRPRVDPVAIWDARGRDDLSFAECITP